MGKWARLKFSIEWKSSNEADIGLIAEDVEKVEPLLVTYNDKGQIEGVKYEQLTVILVNAIKDQQKEIEELKFLICQDHPEKDICNLP